MDLISEHVNTEGAQRVYRLPSGAYWLCYWTLKNGYVSWGLYEEIGRASHGHQIGVGRQLGYGYLYEDVPGFWQMLQENPDAVWASLIL